MPIESILTLLIAAAALLVSAMGLRRNQHGDTAASAAERANMNADIKYIRGSIDDIKLDLRSMKDDIKEMRERLVKVEQSTKSAHNRIDDMQGGA